MTTPSAEDQLQFLTDIQRILDEGSFVATYKYALLMALADLSVEHGDDSGDALALSLTAIAEKFIQYYWRQSVPYPGSRQHAILFQNNGQQAAIINKIVTAQSRSTSLARARRDQRNWTRLVRDVARTVETMPLWKLQVVGDQTHSFLYRRELNSGSITLLSGVAFNFRRFHAMIIGMLQGAWLSGVRKIAQNQSILGQKKDLQEFLFGSERDPLKPFQTILMEQQGSRCFYCEHKIRTTGDVDHFIPWSRYPVDLGHNFVLAHSNCNRQKKDFLAATPHLERWMDRNQQEGEWLAEQFDRKGLLHDLEASRQIAYWSYQQAANTQNQVWLNEKNLIHLENHWSNLWL